VETMPGQNTRGSQTKKSKAFFRLGMTRGEKWIKTKAADVGCTKIRLRTEIFVGEGLTGFAIHVKKKGGKDLRVSPLKNPLWVQLKPAVEAQILKSWRGGTSTFSRNELHRRERENTTENKTITSRLRRSSCGKELQKEKIRSRSG